MSPGTTKSDVPETFQEEDDVLLMDHYAGELGIRSGPTLAISSLVSTSSTQESSFTTSRATHVTPQFALTGDISADARISFPYLRSTATTTAHTTTRNSQNDYLVHEMWDNSTSDDVDSTPAPPISAQLVPPRLPRLASIPLPPLSPNIPVQTHALIAYYPNISPIRWALSLPPSTARLAITTAGNINNQWRHDVAIVPTTLPSITIRIRDIERPLVVFPTEPGNQIRIVDVLNAVYNAVSVAAVGLQGVARDTSSYDRLGVWPPRDVATEDTSAADAIGRGGFGNGNQVWWNGLLPSAGEVDVWILQLQSAGRGRFGV